MFCVLGSVFCVLCSVFLEHRTHDIENFKLVIFLMKKIRWKIPKAPFNSSESHEFSSIFRFFWWFLYKKLETIFENVLKKGLYVSVLCSWLCVLCSAFCVLYCVFCVLRLWQLSWIRISAQSREDQTVSKLWFDRINEAESTHIFQMEVEQTK